MLMLASCNDFLDVLPLNEIVEENYWTEKADVESVLYSCYAQMENNDLMNRLEIWGEVRSDNITFSSSTANDLLQVINENILETNPWLKWESFYQAINRCNTVIAYAPVVAEIDPNYTESEMKAHVAEATWLRTFCFFTLARTFRDIPYSTKPSKSDSDVEGDYRIAATPFNELIPQLIADMEAVRGDALRLYPRDSRTGDAANTSRVSVCAMDALLADLYLWNQQYEKCVECCERVFDYKLERYEELKDEYPTQAMELYLWDDRYPLYEEEISGTTLGQSYNRIFGDGNSFESIFELYYASNQKVTNKLVSEGFGTSSQIGGLSVTTELATDVYSLNNKVFKPTDTRVAANIVEKSSTYQICKYVRSLVNLRYTPGNATAAPTISHNMRGTSNYANWILYRMTDVMLMKAEAEVEINTPQSLDDAFRMVSITYNRANNFMAATPDTLLRTNYVSQQQMRELVLEERRRELMFEGKRWFDLVRYSIRMGDNAFLSTSVTKQQKERVSAITLHLTDPNALFWPYLKRETEVNPKLVQNSAYITNDTSKK